MQKYTEVCRSMKKYAAVCKVIQYSKEVCRNIYRYEKVQFIPLKQYWHTAKNFPK